MSVVRDLFSTAVEEQRPLILLVGQHAWGNADEDDSVLTRALSRVGQGDVNVRGWRSILDGQPLSPRGPLYPTDEQPSPLPCLPAPELA